MDRIYPAKKAIRRAYVLFGIVLGCYWLQAAPAVAAPVGVERLTCERASDPLGIDTQAPRFGWELASPARGVRQTAYRILVAGSEAELARDRGTCWDSRRVRSDRSLQVPYAGETLQPFRSYYWKVRVWDEDGKASPWSEVARFTTGAFSPADWNGAKWIALEADDPDLIVTDGLHGGWGPALDGKAMAYNRLPQFRKSFLVRKPLRQALAAVCGLGQFEFFLNGAKVGDRFLDPAWTKYDKSQQYVLFDITDSLQVGENTAGVMLGNGFYNIPRDRYLKFCASYGYPKLIARIRLEYADGTSETVVSDASWRATGSPVTFSSIYGGEDYDANRELPGWHRNGFDDSSWETALEVPNDVPLLSQRMDPVKIAEKLPTYACTPVGDGHWVYDLGQNFSGVVSLTLRSAVPATVKLTPSELLDKDGRVCQTSSGGPVYWRYTSDGSGRLETWHPQFTYFGFRYVEVEGAVPAGTANPGGLPEIVALEGLHTTSATDRTGSFSCSSPLFNAVFSLIDWSVRNNMASVFTDCPHREKLGWIEQAHLMSPSVQYSYDISRLFPKLVDDMGYAQHPDGLIPAIVPEMVLFEGDFVDTPEWGCAYVLVPWYLYRWYGDKRPLETHYDGMVRYLAYLGSKADEHILTHGLGDWCDIGPEPPGYSQQTPAGVTGTALYYYETKVLARIARLLGKTGDALRFETLADSIVAAFNRRFYDGARGCYATNSQTANAMALYMGFVPKGDERRVLQNLVDDIRNRGYALTCGEIGHRFLLQVLSEWGEGELLYRIYHRYDVPGYGYQLAKGATALTESWQAFGNLSNDHCMMGHLYEWFYNRLGGISQAPESVAYEEIVIDPCPVGDIRWAKAATRSPYGLIRSEWEERPDAYVQLVEIPANCRAQVCLPAGSVEAVTESGIPLDRVESVAVESSENGKIRVRVGSGIYRFRVRK